MPTSPLGTAQGYVIGPAPAAPWRRGSRHRPAAATQVWPLCVDRDRSRDCLPPASSVGAHPRRLEPMPQPQARWQRALPHQAKGRGRDEGVGDALPVPSGETRPRGRTMRSGARPSARRSGRAGQRHVHQAADPGPAAGASRLARRGKPALRQLHAGQMPDLGSGARAGHALGLAGGARWC